MEAALPLKLLVCAFFGGLYLLAGYRTIRFAARLESAVLFMLLGLTVSEPLGDQVLVIALFAVLAVVGWRLGNAYYFVHIGLTGAVAGAMLMVLTLLLLGGPLAWAPCLGAAALGLLLALRFERPVLTTATAAIGALLLTVAAHAPAVMLGGRPEPTWEAGLLFAVLTVLGTLYQFRTRPPVPSGP